MSDIQEALTYADTVSTEPELKALAAAYREKCEKYDRLLEVAEDLRELVIRADVPSDYYSYKKETLKKFEELQK